jgi:membrane-associated PAP2 superfamily phosphatase
MAGARWCRSSPVGCACERGVDATSRARYRSSRTLRRADATCCSMASRVRLVRARGSRRGADGTLGCGVAGRIPALAVGGPAVTLLDLVGSLDGNVFAALEPVAEAQHLMHRARGVRQVDLTFRGRRRAGELAPARQGHVASQCVGPDGWIVERSHEVVRDHPAIVDVARALTGLGTPPLLFGASVVIGVVLVATRRLRAGVLIVTATSGAWLVNDVLKYLVGRDRPTLTDPVSTASGASFPSGHAMVSAAAYGALLVLVLPHVPPARRRLTVASVAALVVVIGSTRVVLGVHWPTDVLGGFVLGIAWLALCVHVTMGGVATPRNRSTA